MEYTYGIQASVTLHHLPLFRKCTSCKSDGLEALQITLPKRNPNRIKSGFRNDCIVNQFFSIFLAALTLYLFHRDLGSLLNDKASSSFCGVLHRYLCNMRLWFGKSSTSIKGVESTLSLIFSFPPSVIFSTTAPSLSHSKWTSQRRYSMETHSQQ